MNEPLWAMFWSLFITNLLWAISLWVLVEVMAQ
jgi:hypothetical protein